MSEDIGLEAAVTLLEASREILRLREQLAAREADYQEQLRLRTAEMDLHDANEAKLHAAIAAAVAAHGHLGPTERTP